MTDRTTNGCSSNNRIHVRGRVSDGGSATARLALCQLNCQSRAGGKQLGAADAWVGAPSWKRWAAPRTGCASRGPAHRAAAAPWRARGGVAAVRPAAPSLGIFGRVCEPSSRYTRVYGVDFALNKLVLTYPIPRAILHCFNSIILVA